MIKAMKTFVYVLLISFLLKLTPVFAQNTYAPLSSDERNAICQTLQNSSQKTSDSATSLDGSIIPSGVLLSIYNTTRNISQSLVLVKVLGDAVMCHAVHGRDQKTAEFIGVKLFDYPNVPMWLCGIVVYFFGFMMVLAITFYVVDIAFKLGMAVLLLPIGIALWPFEQTSDKIVTLISIILKNAAIFIFLALTSSYALNMLSVAVSGLDEVFDAITENADTDAVSNAFTLASIPFLIIVTALIYGFKLIGSAITDYTDKIFPDKAFGGASPIHGMMTQSMDFAKKKVVEPVASFAHDVASTQVGKGVEGAGNLLLGKYNPQIKSGVKNIGIAVRNPGQTLKKAGLSAADGLASVGSSLGKAGNHMKYGFKLAGANLLAGKENRQHLKEQLRSERDQKDEAIHNAYHGDIRQAKAEIDNQIKQNEQNRHDQLMQNDPKYRAKVEADEHNETTKPQSKFVRTLKNLLPHRVLGNILVRSGQHMQNNSPKKENSEDRYRKAQNNKNYEDNYKGGLGM